MKLRLNRINLRDFFPPQLLHIEKSVIPPQLSEETLLIYSCDHNLQQNCQELTLLTPRGDGTAGNQSINLFFFWKCTGFHQPINKFRVSPAANFPLAYHEKPLRVLDDTTPSFSSHEFHPLRFLNDKLFQKKCWIKDVPMGLFSAKTKNVPMGLFSAPEVRRFLDMELCSKGTIVALRFISR